MARCNPYGYATDAGPRHMMGGRYPAEYAGHSQLVKPDGVHGLGICENPATGRYRMICINNGCEGEIRSLCTYHVAWITAHYCRTCTRCVQPEISLQLEMAMESCMRAMSDAGMRGDSLTLRKLNLHLEDMRQEMDSLVAQGIIKAAQPMKLVEVS